MPIILIVSILGIKFYHEISFLGVSPDGNNFANDLKDAAEKHSCHSFKELPSHELEKMYPYIHFPKHCSGVLSDKDTGYINPRDMITAMHICAEKNGCDIIDDIVRHVTPSRGTDGYHTIITDKGRSVRARKVLLAAGAFTRCRHLLPPEVQPDVELGFAVLAMVGKIWWFHSQTQSAKLVGSTLANLPLLLG